MIVLNVSELNLYTQIATHFHPYHGFTLTVILNNNLISLQTKRPAVQLVTTQYQLEDVGIMKTIAPLLCVTFQQVRYIKNELK